ncbi:DNA polymerase-1 [Clostridium pascui]|uniref:DNA polymerase I n=1 Tax=Clostridium pascui TaxID=46609 RepID=UPI00195D73D7|nr:DNA polymerase I [Clostridium pascui]MBM7870157.1 DNA polymerase-1 [Clostridium pascui]
MNKEKLIILDGNSLMNRAFYALPLLTNREGIHTNAVYGFTNMLLKMKEEIEPNYIVCTFDKAAPTFRHNEYKEYKAGRKKMPSELAEQFPIVKELLSKFDINIFEIEGFEADDLIGTLSCKAEEQGIEVYIVTGDRDALQLASDNIKVVLTKKGITEKEIYDANRMVEEYGVTPKQFIDVKGLMGDASDNIPGVPGVGEKTAYKLIKEYGSIESVLNNIENISGKKIKESLIENSEQAIFSKKLATIMCNVPIEIDLDSIKSNENYDAEAIRKMFLDLEFKSLLDKIYYEQKEENKILEEETIEFNVIHNNDQLKNLINNINDNKEKEILFLLFNTENESTYSLVNIKDIYINFLGKNYAINIESLQDKEEFLKDFKYILESGDIKKVSYDVKAPYVVLNKWGVDFKNVIFDIKIAAYLIEPSRSDYNLNILIPHYLKREIRAEGEEKFIRQVSALKDLYEEIRDEIKSLDMDMLYYEVELPLVKVLSFMEQEGFKVDREMLQQIGEKFQIEIDKMQKEIYALADEEFNINSPKQLGKILFEKLDLPVIKKTKTGYSTNAEVLEALNDKHPVIEKITYYRQLTKLYSTYVEGLKNVIDTDEKIHSTFNQTVTTTGRLSSTEPNLQNIPIKYEMGKEIRKVFVAEDKSSLLLSADYSQIELRVLAHISEDENLIDAFKHHDDIHTKTASEVFNVPLDEVTSTMRSNAKAVNFGIVYGIGDFSLAQDLKISRKEAKAYIDAYFDRYPKVKEYMDKTIQQAHREMYVTTILNRRRHIPEIADSKKMIKALGERLAMNTPIQGSAADIIKMAMVKVYNSLKENKLKSKLILQVHDELILNVEKSELEQVREIVKNSMENVMPLNVPLEVDIHEGESWYDAK